MFNRCSTTRQSPVHRPDTLGWECRGMALSRRQLIHRGAAGAGLVVVGNLSSWFPAAAGNARRPASGRARRGPPRHRALLGDRLRPARPRPRHPPRPSRGLQLHDHLGGRPAAHRGRRHPPGRLRRHGGVRGRRQALPGAQQRAGLPRGRRARRVPRPGRRRVHLRPGCARRHDDDRARRRQQRRRRVRQPGRHEHQLRRRRHPVGHLADVRGDRGPYRRRWARPRTTASCSRSTR